MTDILILAGAAIVVGAIVYFTKYKSAAANTFGKGGGANSPTVKKN